MDFKNGVKSIQTLGYNGACTVFKFSAHDSELAHFFEHHQTFCKNVPLVEYNHVEKNMVYGRPLEAKTPCVQWHLEQT